jgi:hypothetical protein
VESVSPPPPVTQGGCGAGLRVSGSPGPNNRPKAASGRAAEPRTREGRAVPENLVIKSATMINGMLRLALGSIGLVCGQVILGAAPITLDFSGVGTGTYNGTVFTNVPFLGRW